MGMELPKKAGLYKQELQLEGGGVLRYTLWLPEGVEGGGALPLVLALHFGGKVTPFYGGDYLQMSVLPAWEKLGAVMVAPDCPGEEWSNEVSERAVLALIECIKGHYAIAEKRVVITGFSLGGLGTWYLVSRHGGLFSAAVPVASIPGVDIQVKDTPFYVINSRADQIFPFEMFEKEMERLKAGGVSVHVEVLEGVGHYEIPRFVPAMREVVPWLKQVWQQQEK